MGWDVFSLSAEVKIAEALDRRQVLFFANVRGRISSHQLPISDRSQVHNVESNSIFRYSTKASAWYWK